MKNLIILLTFLLISSATYAQKWIINEDHSEVFFSVSYLKISEVTGRFHEFRGSLDLNKDNTPKNLMLFLQVDSIETGNKLRDGHLKGNDFLQKNQFPDISFVAKTFIQKASNTFIAKGTLKIKSTSKPHEVEFSITPPIKDTWNYLSRFAKFKTIVNRSHFAIKWNKTLAENKYLVGDTINVWGTFQLQPQDSKTPDNKHMIPDTKYMREREKISRGEIVSETKTSTNLIKDDRKVLKKETTKVPTQKNASQDEKGKTLSWWIAFFIMGLMGFMSVIIISVYSKGFLSELFKKGNQENQFIDYLSDAILIGWVLVYSVALWIIGWGN